MLNPLKIVSKLFKSGNQKELDRISDINAQIEDLSSYLSWIDEFYGTREE